MLVVEEFIVSERSFRCFCVCVGVHAIACLLVKELFVRLTGIFTDRTVERTKEAAPSVLSLEEIRLQKLKRVQMRSEETSAGM